MKYIIGSLVGAIIGYITNWLAIKMLFRPHKEIRFGKFKLPFTPGLIPKEKYRIAKSVGETIGKHLLTKETIIQSLCSENMNEQLDLWVQNKVGVIENSDVTVEDEIKALLGDEYYNFIGHTNSELSELLIGQLNEESVKQAIAKYLKEQIMVELSSKPQDISQSCLYNSIKNKLLNNVIEYKDSEKFYCEIQKVLEEKVHELSVLDKNFQEIMPEGITNSVKVYVYDKKYDIAIGIKKLMRHEKVRRKLRQIVGETIGANLSPMIAMFISSDRIYEKVVIGIDEYLDDEKNHNDIALMINDIIDELLKSSISSVVSDLPKEGIDAGIKSLISLFKEKIVDEKFIRDTFRKVETKFNDYLSIEEMLKDAGIDYISAIESFAETRIEAMAGSDSFRIKLAEVVTIMVNKLLNIKMKWIFKEAGNKIVPSISKVVRDLYNKFIENKAADVIEILDVAKIVEDKINEFDVDFAEQIILEIASKELKAITWLGALLGAIMGLLSPIMSSLY